MNEAEVRIAGIMDTVIKFRGQVREYALNPHQTDVSKGIPGVTEYLT